MKKLISINDLASTVLLWASAIVSSLKKIKYFIDIITVVASSLVVGWFLAYWFYYNLIGWRYVVVIISLTVSLFVAYVVGNLFFNFLIDKFKPKKKGGW